MYLFKTVNITSVIKNKIATPPMAILNIFTTSSWVGLVLVSDIVTNINDKKSNQMLRLRTFPFIFRTPLLIEIHIDFVILSESSHT